MTSDGSWGRAYIFLGGNVANREREKERGGGKTVNRTIRGEEVNYRRHGGKKRALNVDNINRFFFNSINR